MRSFDTVNDMYTVFSHVRDPEQAARAASLVWEEGLRGFSADRKEAKRAKMLDLAAREPHPAFAAFARSIARGAGKPARVDPEGGVHKPPAPAVLPNETPLQSWERMCDAPGKVIDGICAALLAAGESRPVAARVRLRIAREMKAAGIQDGLRTAVAGLYGRGVSMEALFKTLDWLTAVDVKLHAESVVQELQALSAEYVEAKKRGEPLPPVEPRLVPELKEARKVLLLLRVFFPDDFDRLDEHPELRDYLAAALFQRLPELVRDLATIVRARRLPALLEAYKARGDEAIRGLPASDDDKQQALAWCVIMEHLVPWQERWLPRAEALANEEAVARLSRRLRKQPKDPALLRARARLVAERQGKPQLALADLDAALAQQDDADARLQRAIIYAGFGRLGDAERDIAAGLACTSASEGVRETRAKLHALRADLRLRGDAPFLAWCDTVAAALLDPGNPTAIELMDAADRRIDWAAMAHEPAALRAMFGAYVALQRRDFAGAAAQAATAAAAETGNDSLDACAKGLADVARLVEEVGAMAPLSDDADAEAGLMQLLGRLTQTDARPPPMPVIAEGDAEA